MKDRNRALTDALVDAGLPEDQAREQIDLVLGVIAPALIAGKPVHIPGVGDLRSKAKNVYVPGSCDRKARREIRASLRSGSLWKGEPYDVAPPEKSTLTYLNPRAMP